MGEGQAHRVVIVGGGFAGLHVAHDLRRAPVAVSLIDRQHHHLFQPLLYQVATGALSGADITSPLRHALKRQHNARVILDEVRGIDTAERTVALRHDTIDYDTLVVASGVETHYFGHAEWSSLAPGLKALDDAHELRTRLLLAFELAELEPDPRVREALLTFVVVGGGSTGIELAGAIGELAHRTLPGEFRRIDPRTSRVILVEAGADVLPGFPAPLRARAVRSLARLGVEVRTGCRVVGLDGEGVTLATTANTERLPSRMVAWAAGVRGSHLGEAIATATGCALDGSGRVIVANDLTVPGFPDVFVIGDLAHVQVGDRPLPCVAPAAIQEGRHAARLIRDRLSGHPTSRPFRYFDKGMLATIGRGAAVAEFRGLRFWGLPAWIAWLVIHLVYLIEFENRLLVMIQWFSQYLFHGRGARVIFDARARSTPSVGDTTPRPPAPPARPA
jgi:NADH dehydrogenase